VLQVVLLEVLARCWGVVAVKPLQRPRTLARQSQSLTACEKGRTAEEH
jgi:hypothetical protein